MSNTPTIQVFGEPVEILVTSRSTHYTCCVGIQTSQPGDGPPPHKHERNEETFIVLEGAFKAVLHGSPTSIFNDLSHTESAFRPQIRVDCIGIDDFTR